MLQDEVKKHLKKSNTITTASLLPPSSSSQAHHHGYGHGGQGLLRSSTLLPSSSSISPSSSSLLLPGSSSQQSQKFFLSVSEDSADCSSETSLCVPQTVAWWLSSWSLEELQNFLARQECNISILAQINVFQMVDLSAFLHNGNIWKVMSAVEWFQREHECFIWRT